jgi:nucleoid-associated protein YgaU
MNGSVTEQNVRKIPTASIILQMLLGSKHASDLILFLSGVVVSLVLACSVTSFAQSLGDIARQERERRKNQPVHAAHMYTNDDLQKSHILVPEDQARVVAAQKNGSAPWVQASEPPAPTAAPRRDATIRETAPVRISAVDIAHNRPQPPRSSEAATSRLPAVTLKSAAPIRQDLPVVTVTLVSSEADFVGHREIAKGAMREEIDPGTTARVRVVFGDSLWKLAEQHLGNGARWRELAALNPELSDPDHVQVGDWIRLPSAELKPAKRIVVRMGDTLWSVAQAEFGNPFAFTCIAYANPQIQSADLIRAGQALVLPETCAVAR